MAGKIETGGVAVVSFSEVDMESQIPISVEGGRRIRWQRELLLLLVEQICEHSFQYLLMNKFSGITFQQFIAIDQAVPMASVDISVAAVLGLLEDLGRNWSICFFR